MKTNIVVAAGIAVALGSGAAAALAAVASGTQQEVPGNAQRIAAAPGAATSRDTTLPPVPEIEPVSGADLPGKEPGETSADQARSTIAKSTGGKVGRAEPAEFAGQAAWAARVERQDGSVLRGYVSVATGAVIGWDVLREPTPITIAARDLGAAGSANSSTAAESRPTSTDGQSKPAAGEKGEGPEAADTWTGSSGSAGDDKDKGNSGSGNWEDDHDEDDHDEDDHDEDDHDEDDEGHEWDDDDD